MDDNSRPLPTDDQIDQLILDCAFSGRLALNGVDMLVNYVRAMRGKICHCEEYIIPEGKSIKFS